MEQLDKLTIVTITYNNEDELLQTINSFSQILNAGVKCVIINGGNILSKKINFHSNVKIIEEPDKGIYDALNKGQNLVDTKFYMKIHSGDKFISSVESLQELIKRMEINILDVLLGNQTIGFYSNKRKHTSNLWKPFFFHFGCQPPHMPTIYRKSFVGELKYDIKNEVIADFFFLHELFNNKPKWGKSKEFIVEMAEGGITSSGLKSYFLVSKEFFKNYGLFKGVFIFFFRFPLKLFQTFF